MTNLHAPVKGIFFDLGWTLFGPRSGDWMFSEFARKYFPKERLDALPQERVIAAMRAGAEFLDTHHLLSAIEEEYKLFLRYFTMLAEALPELGLNEADIKAVTDEKVYNQAADFYLFEDSIATLEALKGKYRLGVISDTWPSIVPVLEAYGLLPYFDCITYSYTLGVYKPHPKMYEDALSKMGLPPEQTIFIDDTAKNLEGARKAGIQPVLIRAKPDADDAEDLVKIGRISGLLEALP